ncbi:hypothetical protein ACQB60_21810 [Actinomycetota bacterium Odt1-20B]
MATEATDSPVDLVCPGCGGQETRPVEEARGGKGALREKLNSRLEMAPDTGGDGCLHFIEGTVISLMIGGGLAYMGKEQDKPLYIVGGLVLAVVAFALTLMVVRDGGRDRAAARAGEERAERVWRPARYCYGCTTVFCPGGRPWPGQLTPEQFKKLVWTEGGYADQLPAGDKAKDAVLPEA